MTKYSAIIRLSVSAYEAKDAKEAHDKVNAYIDHLVELLETDSGELAWPEVEWVVQEEN